MSKLESVVIIGGGLSGLAAGGLLSRQGFNVKLFEANSKLGGCCGTTNLEGYIFNDGALYLVFPAVLDYVYERLGLDRANQLPLRKISANSTTRLPDGTVVTIGEGLDVRVKRAQGAVDRLRLQKELNVMMRKWEPVLHTFYDSFLYHPFSPSRLLLKWWRHLHKLRGSVASEFTRLLSDEAVRAALSGVLLYAGMPPEKMPTQTILGLIAMMSEGFFLPEGGMGRIPETLSQVLKLNGGEIFLDSKVDKIVIRNGRACGVEVDGAGMIEADAVLSTVSGMLTFGSLIDPEHVPDTIRRKVKKAPLSHKAFSLQLGLSNHIDVSSYTNNVLPFMEEQYKYFIPDEGDVKWVTYSVPTSIEPELAPPSGSIVEMWPPIRQDIAVDDWDEHRKEKIAGSAIMAISHIHDLEIVVKRIRSPRDFQEGMHLYKGAVYGLSPAADFRAQFPHNPPIPGLYQAGQTTHPGYGVVASAMSGIFAAEALMRTSGNLGTNKNV